MASNTSLSDHEIIQVQEIPEAIPLKSIKPSTDEPSEDVVDSPADVLKGTKRFFSWLADLLITEDKDKKEYLKNYNCIPPPLFILTVSLAELVVFLFYAIQVERQTWITLSQGLRNSILIYDPYKRKEAWRFVSYMLLHAGVEHILGNLLLQILVGVLLEMVHNGFRVGIVYMSGVLAGSLSSSMFDPYLCLVGASGGVYALLGGFFSHIVMNWNKIALNGLHLTLVLGVVVCDIGFSLYRRIVVFPNGPPQVSLAAHFAGGLAGITVGYVVFSNYNKSLLNDPKWLACFLSYIMCCCVAVFWNLFLTPVGRII